MRAIAGLTARSFAGALALGGASSLGACGAQAPVTASPDRPAGALAFPRADRPVSSLAGNGFSNEQLRDRNREASRVMDLAGVTSGMSVADVGAGEGYYTVRLGQRVGAKGRVLAENIEREVSEGLGDRVQRDRLTNVSIVLGTPEDPRLPANSFDRVFMIHMYHEVREPYVFLWHVRPALREGGRIVVVDADRASDRHGSPPALLSCEFSSLGLRMTRLVRQPELQGYLAEFEAVGDRPAPAKIVPCRAASDPNSSRARY